MGQLVKLQVNPIGKLQWGFLSNRVKNSMVVFTILVSFFAFPNTIHASTWMQSEGDSVGAIGVSYSTADGFWNSDSNLLKYPIKHQEAVYYQYYEYGYSYYYTILASIAWTYYDSGTIKDSGIDNVKIGVRGRLNIFRNGRTWQVTAILPVKKWDSSVFQPGRGKYGLEAGIFYRLLPDPYETPSDIYTQGIWGMGLGTTLRSGDTGSELWSYGKWEKKVFNPSWKVEVKLSALSSFTGGQSGGVDIYGPNDSYHYEQINSELSLSYSLNKTTGINVSYKRDLWGRNVNMNEGQHIGIFMTWKK